MSVKLLFINISLVTVKSCRCQDRKIRDKITTDMPTNQQLNSATVSGRDYEGIRSEFVDHACSHLSALNIHSQFYHYYLRGTIMKI